MMLINPWGCTTLTVIFSRIYAVVYSYSDNGIMYSSVLLEHPLLRCHQMLVAQIGLVVLRVLKQVHVLVKEFPILLWVQMLVVLQNPFADHGKEEIYFADLPHLSLQIGAENQRFVFECNLCYETSVTTLSFKSMVISFFPSNFGQLLKLNVAHEFRLHLIKIYYLITKYYYDLSK